MLHRRVIAGCPVSTGGHVLLPCLDSSSLARTSHAFDPSLCDAIAKPDCWSFRRLMRAVIENLQLKLRRAVFSCPTLMRSCALLFHGQVHPSLPFAVNTYIWSNPKFENKPC